MKTHIETFRHSIEVWNIHLPDHQDDTALCRSLLTGEELERAAKFIKPSDAEGFILGRGLLRRILADCLRVEPFELCFNRSAQGKPFLEGGEIEFNVSHSRDRLLIAVTAGRAVGVDIEFRRSGLNMEAIANRWFAPEEQAFFQTLPALPVRRSPSEGGSEVEGENRQKAFFEIWAKKEAYVKALGVGIYKDLNTFAVPVVEKPFSPVLGNDERWFFQTLEIYDANGVIDSSYAAAVVSEAPPVPVNLRTV